MQTKSKIFDDIAKVAISALDIGFQAVRTLRSTAFEVLGSCTENSSESTEIKNEDIEIAKQMAQKAREQFISLEKRVEQLEQAHIKNTSK